MATKKRGETTNQPTSVQSVDKGLKAEFSIDSEGKGSVSRRGIARMCGVNSSTIQKLLKKVAGGDAQTLHEVLQPFSGRVFESDAQIPDIFASAIIKNYAYQGKKTAQATDIALGAAGLRALIQEYLGWRPVESKRLSHEEIIDLCCLPVPAAWQRRFPEEFYAHLSRLTGLSQYGTSRPALWAAKTKELVYDYLPNGVYGKIKRCKAETGGYEKLHQFLSEDGLQILEKHQHQLLTLMAASANMSQLKTLLDQSCSRNYQLLIF